VIHVPGAWELPVAASSAARSRAFDAIVALGALIRGETAHFDVLAAEVARGLGQVALDTGIPVVFGVLTTDTERQALARANGEAGDKGWEAALAALEMVDVLRRLG
jgi:6,7-dimethyl-8-ribityllumazine synthase